MDGRHTDGTGQGTAPLRGMAVRRSQKRLRRRSTWLNLQHNMLVAGTQKAVLSIINGGGKWVEADHRKPTRSTRPS